MKITDAIDFLRESNNIENVWGDDALAQAIYAWEFVLSKAELTPSIVLKTHKILMLNQRLLPNEKGYFRKQAVTVGGRMGKPWYAVPALIGQWCHQANSLNILSSVEEYVQKTHVDYEKIHPFIDGNGRTGRIFMNWQRVRIGLPILVIRESERGDYYKWFE